MDDMKMNERQAAVLAYFAEPSSAEARRAVKELRFSTRQTEQALTRSGLLESCDGFPYTQATDAGREALAAYREKAQR